MILLSVGEASPIAQALTVATTAPGAPIVEASKTRRRSKASSH